MIFLRLMPVGAISTHMPISRYYKGKGKKVLASMKKRYGAKKGKSVFYATANARGLNPGGASDAKVSKQFWKKGKRK